ncbi:hypothetical protein PPL_11096 [Heterostelium album PN500]|uniref:Ankyrin repeat-containing protein n=1 Tax=Heterostelium pallidum (strain ATCC 26659 / Pp 5 / PN500) TaxID=670386 RepID=D3BSX6_HETP5|nr:hypothetical protein PPL_11096 [Heterostelium album PN500]EFA75591.1 hypothetical protein PPL_11096 [Heterostelium album PN500]|eukprot:XP_020427725.1 hypothetical protein PPL_11096 [Heterostelium album PN500]
MYPVIELEDNSFDFQVLQNHTPVVVLFLESTSIEGDNTNGEAISMSQQINDLNAIHYFDIKFARATSNKCQSLITEYNVSSFPTTITFVDGYEFSRTIGILTQQIEWIHEDILREFSFKWKQAKSNPNILAVYGYDEMLIRYFKDKRDASRQWYHFLYGNPLEQNDIESLVQSLRSSIRLNKTELVFQLTKEYPLYSRIPVLARSAIKYGRLDILKYLDKISNVWYSNDYGLSYYYLTCWASKSKQNLEILKWLVEEKLEKNKTKEIEIVVRDAINYAARAGQLEKLQYLIGRFNLNPADHNRHLIKASKSGSIPVVEYLLSKGLQFQENQDYVSFAASKGHFELVKYMISKKIGVCSETLLDSASYSGNFHLIKWLHLNGSTSINVCSILAMDYAALHSLEQVVWFQQNRTEGCSYQAMEFAIKNNHLDIVKWLHTNKKETCFPMALLNSIYSLLINDIRITNSHLDLFQYLYDNQLYGAMQGARYIDYFQWAIRKNIKNNKILIFLLTHPALFELPIDYQSLLSFSKTKQYRNSYKIIEREMIEKDIIR